MQLLVPAAMLWLASAGTALPNLAPAEDRCYSVHASGATAASELGRLPTLIVLKPGPSQSIWGDRVRDVDWIGGVWPRSFFDGEGDGPHWTEQPGRLFIAVGGWFHGWRFELASSGDAHSGSVHEHVDVPGQDFPVHMVSLARTDCPAPGPGPGPESTSLED